MSWDAVVVDLDGTLLKPDGQVGQKTQGVLARLRQKGIPVFVATGRPWAGAESVLQGIDVEPVMAVYNGTQIVDRQAGQALQKILLPDELVHPFCHRLEEDSHDHIVYHEEVKHLRSLKYHDLCQQLADIFINVRFINHFSEVPDGERPRISCFGLPEDLEPFAGWLRDHEAVYVEKFPFTAIAAFPESPMWYLEAQAACEGKKELLNYLEKTQGISASRVIAFGDQSNDVTLLKHAGHGVAMSNAFASCRQVADEMIGSNTEEAVASYLEKIYL